MESIETEFKHLDIAVQRHRKLLQYVTNKCVPVLETKLREADENSITWKERALKAETRIALLERQLEEKTNQTIHYKKLYEGQYQVMMKTGSVMGEIVWKSFKSQSNVKMLVQAEETMLKYCAFAKGIIDSFLLAYGTDMPPQQSLEHVFVISVVGALTNFAAFAEGRAFLAKQEDVLRLMRKMLLDQERWNIPQARFMKRMVLTFAYNMSLEDPVAYFMLGEEKLINGTLRCLSLHDPTDVVGAAVAIIYRLLSVSLQAGIPSALPEKIPWTMINTMTSSTDKQLGEISKSLLDVMESRDRRQICKQTHLWLFVHKRATKPNTFSTMEEGSLMQKLVKPENRDDFMYEPKHFEILSRKHYSKRTPTSAPKQKKSLSRKEIKELGIYTIPHGTVTYADAFRLHKMWCGYFSTILSAKNKPKVKDARYNSVVSCLLKADYHGAKIRIVRSKQSSVVGMKGIVVLETKGTFKMVSKDNKLRTIPKNDSQFEVITQDMVVTLFGKHLNARPAERSVKKTKMFAFPDL
uniref:Ribonuclease P protein subunit p29 n=1 Tax=Anopheles dirus TaxID=7168 RepID=A0A182MXV6_9DIPT